MDKLPREVINKIMLFMSHPVADIFKEAYIQYFKEREEEQDEEELDDEELENYCDCCARVWDDCECWCQCGNEYKFCRYSCVNG